MPSSARTLRVSLFPPEPLPPEPCLRIFHWKAFLWNGRVLWSDALFLLRGVPSPSQNRPDPQAADTVLLPELRQIPHRPRFRSCLPVHSHRLRLPDSDMPLLSSQMSHAVRHRLPQ